MRLYAPRKLTGKYLTEVIESRHLTTGPQVQKLREEIATEFDLHTEQVAVGNAATNCIQAIVDLLRSKIPTLSYCMTPEASFPLIIETLRKIMFRAPSQHEAGLLVLTDIGGATVWEQEFAAYRKQCHGKGYILHDACHSCNPLYSELDPDGRPRNLLADFTVMSFYPTKLLSGAEGGLILCKDRKTGVELQTLLNCGFPDYVTSGATRTWQRDSRGRKAGMTDVSAALNREALAYLPFAQSDADKAWHKAVATFTDMGGSRDLIVPQHVQPYLLQQRVSHVTQARAAAAELAVPTGWNFPPEKVVTLPCHLELTDEDVDRVAQAMLFLETKWT